MRHKCNICCLLIAVWAIALVACPVFAATTYQRITAPETKLLLEKEDGVLLINVLSQLEFELHHIPGSISIPIDRLKKSSLLPEDKDISLIFYCMGVR